jgi:lipopolysaccharide/colanic/teichoic acid biosynthesis glycosyltransferase
MSRKEAARQTRIVEIDTMEQRILANKRSSSGDVELTLVSTHLPELGTRPAFRETPTAPEETSARVGMPPEWQARVSPVYLLCKRVIDVLVSLVALGIALVPMMVLAVCIRLESPGSPLHRRRVLAWQDWDERMGNEALQTFDAYKLRTMISDADEFLLRNPHLLEAFEKDWKLEKDPRVTRLGAKLRATSIDEFPQLLNVLKGEMTLVGPRMITVPELARYGDHASRLLSVKPGLTGLWQVSGRQELSYEERVRLDMTYIESRSLRLDIQILLKTVVCVLQRKGAY